MTPQEFIRKWKAVDLTERSAAHSHFIDLCRLFEHPTPTDDDPRGERFTFEKGVTKTGGGDGFADVWKKGFFAWEYKKKRRNLDAALEQLSRYAAALEYPPLHVACDIDRIVIVTAWTNTVSERHTILLDDLATPAGYEKVRAVFFDPDRLKPQRTRQTVTAEAAKQFVTIAERLQHREPDSEAVAHFINQLVFCFFAEDVRLLPEGFFSRVLRAAFDRPLRSREYLDRLFEAMASGGDFDLTAIRHFNGGLFDGRPALKLDQDELALLVAIGSLDWGQIDPTIFGTLFERFLDPAKRAQIGAHYTDTDKIMMIVEPVVLRPLAAEWEAARTKIEAALAPIADLGRGLTRTTAKSVDRQIVRIRSEAETIREAFMERLRTLSILDPACGSGNFLYLALQGVKDLEHRANLECEALGLVSRLREVGPEILHGIEINRHAAELARTTIWIGHIQWAIRNGYHAFPTPVLRKLDTIECRDALIERDPATGAWREAEWPKAEFIIGNPPFLGGKLLRAELGDDYVNLLFQIYRERVAPEGDLVVYWVTKSYEAIRAGHARRVGLVTTNSIRGGANRRILDAIVADHLLFEAWSDEPWVVEGAAVRVSLICLGAGDVAPTLDGGIVERINADLTPVEASLTQARLLAQNAGVCFQGVKFGGPFEVPAATARYLLGLPRNPNGRHNADVVRRWCNGMDITRRREDRWCIDFGMEMLAEDAALFEAPFKCLLEAFDAESGRRDKAGERALRLRESRTATRWWVHQRPRGEMRMRLQNLARFIATPEVSKHRLFVFFETKYLTSGSVYAIARDDDTTLGILHSRFHEEWSLRLGTSLEDRPRYTPTTTFETFPFPERLTPDIPAKDYAADPRAIRIAAAAKRVDELRNAWLNPPDLVEIVPEVVPGYPDRVLPKNADAAIKLRERTLTKLYNARPQWLADAHAALDGAVAAAYDWPEDISVDDALARLLELNLARSGADAAPVETEAEAN